MSKLNYLLFSSIMFCLLLAGGFFIGQINNSDASSNLLAYNDGNIASSTGWIYQNCSQGAPSGDNYIILTKSTSSIISSLINLDGYASKKLDYKARTYGGVTSTSAQISISLSTDSGVTWTPIASATPADAAMSDQAETDLSAYSGSIQIKFEVLFATGSKGVGLDEIKLIATLPNQPPQAFATVSASSTEVSDEIIFDGRNSTDDGAIIDWYWDFGNGHSVYASTTSYAYGSSGIFNVYLSVTDDQGLTATSAPLHINISDPIISTTTATSTEDATTTPTSTPQILNPGDLVINEVYPSPASGEKEWVEIFNNTTSSIDLAGLYLLNIDGGKFVTTTLSGLIEPGAFKVIEDITGSLNNSGDTVVLRNMLRNISETVYGDFSDKADASWARVSNGSYAETVSITKGMANIITARPARVANNSGSGGGEVSYATLSKTLNATTTASSTVAAIDYTGKIIINEIYPNPNGGLDEEFIELLNISTTTIKLANFIVMDSSKSKHLIKSSSAASSTTTLKPGAYYVFRRSDSNIALNNTGVEAVNLYSPDFKLLDKIEYLGENIKGASYSRTDDGKWHWVKTATPGAINADDKLYPDKENAALLGDVASQVKLVGVVKTAGKSAKAIQETTLEKIKDFAAGDQIRAKGVVSVLPGAIGSQYFYIFDSNFGVQVYSNKKDFPALQLGDYIEVTGELSDTSTGRRIKTTSRDQIKIIEHRDEPIAQRIAGAEIGEEYEGSLVSVSGEMLEIKSRNITIADGSDEVTVYINNQINLKDVNAKPGDKITVIGIVGKTSSGYRLMPRDLKDIVVQAGQVKGDFATASPTSSNSTQYYLLAIIIFLLVLIAMLYFKIKRK